MAMAWCFPEETTAPSKGLLDRMIAERAVVPGFWLLEVANVLALAEKKRRITPVKSAEFIDLIESFDLEVDEEAPKLAFRDLLQIARDHSLTSYDAAYLELALRRRLPLATLDDDLRKQGKARGIELLGK